MSRRWTAPLWLAGALIAALLVAWLLRTTLPAPPSNPAGTRIEWVEPGVAPLPTERVPVDAGTDAAASEPSANAVTAADRTITLRALLDDGRPAAGARVDVAALQPTPEWWWPDAYPPFEDEAKPTVQASFTTDTQGEVRLPWRHEELGRVPITVQHGVAFAATSIRATAQPGSTHEVQLATDQSLQVRVVDANDLTAPSVLVGVRATVRRSDGRDETGTMLAKARTDAAGSATFAHVQSWLARITPEPTRRFEVYASLPGGDVGATLGATALPREPLVLHVAPSGSIEVTAHAADGTPLTGEVIGLVRADTDSVVVAPITPPVTTIPHVPLGQRWRAWIPGHGSEEFDGPRAAGETVKVTLRAEPHLIVVGRLLRAGSPLANTRVSVHGLTVLLTYPTDAAGRFRLVPSPSREAVQTIHFDAKDDQRVTWRATWRGNLQLTPATHDLGDLHLELRERGPRMVSGRVVAPCGLDSVRLEAFRQEGRRVVEVEQDVTLKVDGTFVIHGADPGGGLALAIESRSHMLEPSIPFAFGQEVLVTLRAGVRLVASFPVESRQLARCLRIGLEAIRDRRDEDDDWYVKEPDWQSFDGNTVECAWNTCESGPYRLTVRFDKVRGTAVVSTDVNLPENAREVRLPPLKVPDARLVRMQVPRPARSERTTQCFTSVRRIVGDDAADIGVEDASGQWLLALTEPVDVRVHVPGYRARVLRAVFADTTVTLDPAIPMDLIVEAPGAPDGATINVTLFGCNAFLEATVTNGRAYLLLPDAGEYSIDVRVYFGWADREEWSCEPDTITVPEHGGTFTVRVRPGRK